VNEQRTALESVNATGALPSCEGVGPAEGDRPADATTCDVLSMTGRRDSLLHGAAASFFASILSVAFGVVTSVVLARSVGPEGKGRYDLINATLMLACAVFGLSIESGIGFWVAKGAVAVRGLVVRLTGIAAFQVAAVWLTVVAMSRTSLAKAILPLEYRDWGAAAVALGAIAMLLSQYSSAVLMGLQRFVLNASLSAIGRFFTMFAVVLAVVAAIGLGQADVTRWAIWAMIGSLWCTAIVSQGFAWAQDARPSAPVGMGAIFRYSSPCYVANLAQFLSYRVDLFFVAYFVGERELALYTTAVSLAQLLWIPSRSLQGVLFPNLTSLGDPAAQASRAAKASRTLLLLLFVLGVGMSVLGPCLIILLFGRQFSGSIPCLWLLLPGIVLFSIPQSLACHIGAIGKPRLNLVASVVGLVVTLVLNAVLVPTMGIAGAAITSSLSYTVTAAGVLWFFLRESRLGIRETCCFRRQDLDLLASKLRWR